MSRSVAGQRRHCFFAILLFGRRVPLWEKLGELSFRNCLRQAHCRPSGDPEEPPGGDREESDSGCPRPSRREKPRLPKSESLSYPTPRRPATATHTLSPNTAGTDTSGRRLPWHRTGLGIAPQWYSMKNPSICQSIATVTPPQSSIAQRWERRRTGRYPNSRLHGCAAVTQWRKVRRRPQAKYRSCRATSGQQN